MSWNEFSDSGIVAGYQKTGRDAQDEKFWCGKTVAM